MKACSSCLVACAMVVHAMAYPWIRLAAFVLQKSRTAALFNRHSCRLQHCNLRIVVRFELHVSCSLFFASILYSIFGMRIKKSPLYRHYAPVFCIDFLNAKY